MTNGITPPILFKPLNLETCRADPQWCKKEITKRLMLLLLEYTRSKPLPFMAHIEPFGPGPTRPPVQPSPSGEIYTIASNITDGILWSSDNATWTLARERVTANHVDTSSESYSHSAQGTLFIGLYYCHRSWFDFDLSSIPSGLSIVSATLKLRTTGPYLPDICIQEGTQNIPLISNDFQAFTGDIFAAKTTSVGLNTIDLNSTGMAYLETVLGATAKLCAREYNIDYLNVAPVNDLARIGLYFAETPSDDDKPMLTITTG